MRGIEFPVRSAETKGHEFECIAYHFGILDGGCDGGVLAEYTHVRDSRSSRDPYALIFGFNQH